MPDSLLDTLREMDSRPDIEASVADYVVHREARALNGLLLMDSIPALIAHLEAADALRKEQPSGHWASQLDYANRVENFDLTRDALLAALKEDKS